MDYTLERKDRKTVSISVRNGQVVVLAPRRVALSFIETFVQNHHAWIARQLARDRSARSFLDDVLRGDAVLYRGRRFPVVLRESGQVILAQDALYLPAKDSSRALSRWLRRQAKTELGERLQLWAKHMAIEYKSFSVTTARTRWGSCSSDGTIRLNVRLLSLDCRLVDYVIVHELCHRWEMNHSEHFWRYVRDVLPDYKERWRELKKYSLLLTELPY